MEEDFVTYYTLEAREGRIQASEINETTEIKRKKSYVGLSGGLGGLG